MDQGLRLLSDATVHSKYARYMDSHNRRETYYETVERNRIMHLTKFPHLEKEINEAYRLVHEKKVLPSMRSMQFAGPAIWANQSRGFNCSYLPVDDYHAFSEVMFLLLGGTGVGYSVEHANIDQLPVVSQPGAQQKYIIEDSIMGWAEAVRFLFKAYMKGGIWPVFDYSSIREKGARLITSGGKAPGPEPLRDCLEMLEIVLIGAQGSRLTSVEVHDCMCIIADAVLAGGIRRAAMIAFFDKDDEEMATCKAGTWWETHPYRARANNSMVAYRPEFTKADYDRYWNWVKESKCGEPGIFWTDSKTERANPCVEAGLRPNTFCNLTELNAALIRTMKEYLEAAWAASFIGTLQASYTDFHYLRPIWKQRTEEDALIGVGLTGVANADFLALDHRAAAEMVVATNETTAKKIGINKAARTTLIKPSGTTSVVLGCSSGVHAWHAKAFLRRIRVGKNEAIYKFFAKHLAPFLEDDVEKPSLQAVLSIPVRAPAGSITRDEENALDLLGRVRKFYDEWVRPGHNRGENGHSISVTVSVKDHEWDEVGQWLWTYRDSYACASILPYNGGIYRQAPFETITDAEWFVYHEVLSACVGDGLNFEEVIELEDTTSQVDEVACAGGACEVKFI
jgi:ribonucleoside-triphosphate reductase